MATKDGLRVFFSLRKLFWGENVVVELELVELKGGEICVEVNEGVLSFVVEFVVM